jgi:biofilm PGA synthesis N-glycosyltransferase PgaC
VELLFLFVFLYPLFMAIFWMIGAILFFRRREAGDTDLPVLDQYPPVAILVPCHNEEENIRDTISQLARNTYPDFEILAINDGSTDGTGRILAEMAGTIDRLRVITLERNLGKAMALRAGAMASRAEFLMCVDADALLEPDALHWMMPHFVNGARVAAVTGNPRVLNKRGLLSRIQVGEFSAIVGMVKRGQRDIGRIFTVSGVHVCFRRRALQDVGYWSPETVTEDIDISWKLQLRYWDIRYEPRALTWIVVPETLRGLWRQRLRWARGGVEAALKYAHLFKSWSLRRMWPVYTEYILGAAWCYAWAATVVFWIMTQLLPDSWPQSLAVHSILPKWTGVILGVTCLLQFTVGLYLDSHYEKGIFRSMFWAIWYPALYWMLSGVATIVAIPQALYYRDKILYATWKSPERRAQP